MIRAATVRLIPPEQAAEIGDRMLIALIEAHGPPCDDPEGERALGTLAAALEPDAPPRLRVMDLGRTPAVAALPGGTVLIDRETAATATPEELAGRVAAAIDDRSGPGAGRRRRHPRRRPLRLQRPLRRADAGARRRIGHRGARRRAAGRGPAISRNPTGRPSAASAASG